jgi:predicted ATPase
VATVRRDGCGGVRSCFGGVDAGYLPRKPFVGVEEPLGSLDALADQAAGLPTYFPAHLCQADAGRSPFDAIRQRVQVVVDRSVWDRWRAEERERARDTGPLRLVQPKLPPGATVEGPDKVPQHGRGPARLNNLPVYLTGFIGREREIDEIKRLLSGTDVRLLTLWGPGGTGKTRLAIQSAADIMGEFENGVCFLSLESIEPSLDPSILVSSIAQVLKVPEADGRPLLDLLKDHMREMSLLLVMDNFEHLLRARTLVTDLLKACPRLKVLATSRRPLESYGEQLCQVDPLSQEDAVQLFKERARRAKADFVVTNNEPDLAEICDSLDGLPLAIELAAAQIRRFSTPKALRAHLRNEGTLNQLVRGSSDVPERQRQMGATIDWSYRLLDKNEQALFQRLATFAGGCSLEAAEQVCNAEHDLPMSMADGLESLADNSLLRRQPGGISEEPGFIMLKTVREFALEKLEASEEVTLRRLHAEYYLRLVEQADQMLLGNRHAEWLDRMRMNHDNLRAALQWSIDRSEVELGLRLVCAAGMFWSLQGYWSEGRDWLTRVFALPKAETRTALRAQALLRAWSLAFSQGDVEAASTHIDEALSIYKELGSMSGRAESLNRQADQLTVQGNWEAAHSLLKDFLAAVDAEPGSDTRLIASVWTRLGFVAYNLGYTVCAGDSSKMAADAQRAGEYWHDLQWSLHTLGCIEQEAGNLEAARAYFTDSLQINKEASHEDGESVSLFHLGDLALDERNYKDATLLLSESLRIQADLGNRVRIATSLEAFAGLAAAQDQASRALRLAGAAAALRKSIGTGQAPPWQAKLDQRLAPAREVLGQQTANAWAEGQAMPLKKAVGYALEEAAAAS